MITIYLIIIIEEVGISTIKNNSDRNAIIKKTAKHMDHSILLTFSFIYSVFLKDKQPHNGTIAPS